MVVLWKLILLVLSGDPCTTVIFFSFFFYLIFTIDNTERGSFSIISIWNNYVFCRNILDEFILVNVTQTFGCDTLVRAVALPLVRCASWSACGRMFIISFLRFLRFLRFLFVFFNFGVDLGSFPLKVIWFLYSSSLNLVRNLQLGWNNYKSVKPWYMLIHTKHSSETLLHFVRINVHQSLHQGL